MDRILTLDTLISAVRSAVPEDPLAQLEEASRRRVELGELTDALLGHFVDQARRAGCSWSQIGDALGVSKQAVQQRHTARSVPTERLTERTRTAIDASTAEARRLGHPSVGTEHLLLGILSVPECLAAEVLAEAGVTAAALEAHVVAETGPAAGTVRPDEPLPNTPAATRCLVGTLEEALRLGHNYIGTEHLLLALYREPDGSAARFLDRAGLTADLARARIVERCARIAAAKGPSGAG